jgi:hypothetical protein
MYSKKGLERLQIMVVVLKVCTVIKVLQLDVVYKILYIKHDLSLV